MQKYGLIGYPLKHSFSIGYFNEKFKAENIDAEYVNFEIPRIEDFMEVIEENPNLCGLNVTIPYKEQVIPYLDELDKDTAKIGAVNVIKIIRLSKGKVKLVGYNSDIIGFTQSIEPLLQPQHKKALILGTGGASKAVYRGLENLGIKSSFVSRAKKEDKYLTYEELTPEIMQEYTVIVNCTPVGMYPKVDFCPNIPYELLTPNHLLYDLLYNPNETLFMKKRRHLSRLRTQIYAATCMFEQYPELQPWVDSLVTVGALKDFYIENDHGETLHALYVAATHPTPKTAVIVHGYTDNAVRMLMIGYLYNKEMDFNILLPDLYGHGMSEGNHAQMGWKDRLDVLQWTETADELFGRRHTDSVASRSTEMVVHGISMGAATTMMVSGEVEHGQYQQPFIKCFVEDCGYTSVWDEFRGELKAQFNLPAFPLLHTANWLCRQEYGWDFLEASALEQVKKCTLPMLFIHGDADTFVPTWMVYPLYEAKPEPKELWIVPGATHAMSYKDYPQEYTEHVKKFVGKYIH